MVWLEPEEIADGVAEGRFSEATALRLLQHRDECLAAARREVMAHSNAQALQQAHDALDRGHPGAYSEDEFTGLFPPSAPLGHAEEPKTSLIYPGEQQGRRDRSSVTWDGYTRASASTYDGLTDDEKQWRALFGRAPKPGEMDDGNDSRMDVKAAEMYRRQSER